MTKYKIPQKTLSLANGWIKFTFHGTVAVDFPKASIQIPVSVSVSVIDLEDYTYKLHLDPENGRWVDQDEHLWSIKEVPVTVRLSIDKNIPKLVKAEVLHGKKVKWQDTFDMYEPYKLRKVEMFAQPAFIEPIKSNADHTYAVGYGDDGKRNYLWPCGGDHDENQRSLGSGEAFQPECDCLSQIHSDLFQGLAGIRYGLDGVCHQATNRIVSTAGLEVNDAKGYKQDGWKYLTYTLYGRLGLKALDGVGLKVWNAICHGCLTKKYPSCSQETVMLQNKSDHRGLTQEHIDDICKNVEFTRKTLLSIYERLTINQLTPLEYSNNINTSINTFKNELVKVLGVTLHQEMFGDVVNEDVVVVVPKIAQRVFANGAPDLAAFSHSFSH